MTAASILIVEDDANIRCFPRVALEDEGFAVHEADSLRRGFIEAATRQPQLLIVDFGLPDQDGKTSIREFRTWSIAPVLVLSAREHEEEKVLALDADADDYLSKPFGVLELIARVCALLRGRNMAGVQTASSRIRFGDIEVDLAGHKVLRGVVDVHLTPIEFRLLSALIRGHGKVLTHRQLLQ